MKIWKIINRSLICLRMFKGSLYKILSNYRSVNLILDKYVLLVENKGSRFRFDFFYDTFTKSETMCLSRSNTILANSAWAIKLVLHYSVDLENGFLFTVGHELTHKDGDFPTTGFHSKNKKFVNWANEVHADFGAAEKMVNSSREKLLTSMDYKIAAKPNSIDSRSHPSWEHRKEYAELGAFDEKLIRRIALDVDCKNETLITDVVKFYKDIILI